MGYTVITRPFYAEKCNSLFLRSNKQPSVLQWWQRSTLQALSDELWAYFMDWPMCYFIHVCLMNIAYEATDYFLMFVCHYNMFVLMFVIVSVLLTVSYFFMFLFLTYLRKFFLQNYRSGLHSFFISGALCDQLVVFSCIMCLCLTISVKLNKPF